MPLPTLDNLWDSVHETMSLVRGGYAVVVLIKGIGMLVFRDPHGHSVQTSSTTHA